MKNKGIIVFLFFAGIVAFSVKDSFAAGDSVPKSISEYIESSDLVVIGRILRPLRIHTFYGYQANAAERARLDQLTPLKLGIPMVDYEIGIEEIVRDDKKMLSPEVESLTFRVLQSHEQRDIQLAQEENLGRFIFFLSINPDNQTYGIWTPAHKVNIDGIEPFFYDRGKVEAINVDVATVEDFLSSLKAFRR